MIPILRPWCLNIAEGIGDKGESMNEGTYRVLNVSLMILTILVMILLG